MCKECGNKCLNKCMQRMAGEQNLIMDENNENLADYPPGNIVRTTPTFTVVKGPKDCGTFLASNVDGDKQIPKV